MTPLFSLEGATFAVEGLPLIHPLTLDIAAGRLVGLIGHNGSGKSTLLKLLARQHLGGGRIAFAGRPLAAWNGRDFARRVGYIPQAPAAAPNLTVRELVAMGRYPWHGALGRFGAPDQAYVAAALVQAGVEALAGRLVETLSGGERQRAWLALLLAQGADCLLLDEPTSALDIAHQIEMLALVRALSRERALSVIVVLHDVNMAARFCDEIIALHSGRVIARGGPRAIMQPDTLQRIYGVAMGVAEHPTAGCPLCYAL